MLLDEGKRYIQQFHQWNNKQTQNDKLPQNGAMYLEEE